MPSWITHYLRASSEDGNARCLNGQQLFLRCDICVACFMCTYIGLGIIGGLFGLKFSSYVFNSLPLLMAGLCGSTRWKRQPSDFLPHCGDTAGADAERWKCGMSFATDNRELYVITHRLVLYILLQNFAYLRRIYPRLQVWFEWFNTTQVKK